MRCLYDPEYRGLVLAKLIKSADVDYVKMMGSIMEWRIYKRVLPSLLYWNQPVRIEELHVCRQRRWILSAHNVKVIHFDRPQRAEPGGPPVRCLLYQNTSQPLNDKLVLHMHGGGFIIGSPESHDVSETFARSISYLISWPDLRIFRTIWAFCVTCLDYVLDQQLVDASVAAAAGGMFNLNTIFS